jgi:hypothetical protein
MHADEIFSSIELSDVYFLAKLATCMQQNGATICGKCRTPFMDTNTKKYLIQPGTFSRYSGDMYIVRFSLAFGKV